MKRLSNVFCLTAMLLAVGFFLSGCTMRHTIEPSDKPLIVNLNVKVDHEIRVKIKDENKDLINLEENVMKKKKKG